MAELTTRVENMEDVQNLPEQEKKSLAATAPDHLSIQDRKEVVQRFGVSGPAQEAADRLWRIIVTSCAIVLIGSFLALAPVATGTDTVMLTVFTTAAGFLAGLLSLSPLSEGLTRERTRLMPCQAPPADRSRVSSL
jgi:VIT1/CCC1 family predicted Fe2+/Mn2+ transporter